MVSYLTKWKFADAEAEGRTRKGVYKQVSWFAVFVAILCIKSILQMSFCYLFHVSKWYFMARLVLFRLSQYMPFFLSPYPIRIYGRSAKHSDTFSNTNKNSFTAIHEIIKSFKIPRLQHEFYGFYTYTLTHTDTLINAQAFFALSI